MWDCWPRHITHHYNHVLFQGTTASPGHLFNYKNSVREELKGCESAVLVLGSLQTPKTDFHIYIYESCSKSNASCFTVLAHNVRGRRWWHGIRCGTFPTTSCYILLADGIKGTVWQNGVWHGSVFEAKEHHRVLPWGKNDTHWHSLMPCWKADRWALVKFNRRR